MPSFSELRCRLKTVLRIIAGPLRTSGPRFVLACGLACGLALGLAGCSTLKLAYNNLPEVAYWWLNSYFDFESNQTARVRNELDRLLAWHRREELPQWIGLLQKAKAQAPRDITPAQACEMGEAIRLRLLALVQQGEPAAAQLALTLSSAQLDNLQKKNARLNADYRSDWLDKSREAQQKKRYEQWLERSEDFYGKLDEAQKGAMRQMMAESAFSATLFDAERKRRQGVLLASLRALVAENGTPASQAQRALHAYVLTVSDPPPGRWREQQQALWQEGCRNFARLHNMTTTAQREQAVRKLRAYEANVRELLEQ